jgi:hypothetical protein
VSKKQQVNFRFDTNLLEALKEQAEVEGVSYTDLIQRFCKQGLGRNTIQPTIQSLDFTIQSVDSAIQPDILKQQLKAELREELADSINELVKVNLEGIRGELLGENKALRQQQSVSPDVEEMDREVDRLTAKVGDLDLEKQNLADELAVTRAELEKVQSQSTINQLPEREKLNQECDRLLALSQKLCSENEELLKKLQDTRAELKEVRSQKTDASNFSLPDLAKIRDRTLAELKLGKQAPGFHQPRPERDED